MDEVSVRDLRNHGGRVLDRVLQGESLTVVKAGTPVARLVPLRRPPLSAQTLVERWRRLPAVDPERLARDIDQVLDPTL